MSAVHVPGGEHEAAVAFHEAAHAVIWTRLGVTFQSVEILDGDPLGRSGAVFGHPERLGSTRDKFVAGLLAGSVAEAMFTGRTLQEIADTCGQIDFAVMEAITADLSRWQLDAHLKRTARLVERNSFPICRVAVELLEHRHLTQDVVRRLMNEGRARDLAVVA